MSKGLIAAALFSIATVAFACSSGSGGTGGEPPGPTVQIIMPTPGEQFSTTDMVNMEGHVVDPVDGVLIDPNVLDWTLQHGAIIDPVGNGPSDVFGPVDAGSYTLVFTATDSRGKQGEAQVDIVVH